MASIVFILLFLVATVQLPAAFCDPYQGVTIPSITAPSGVPFASCDSSGSIKNNSEFQRNLNIVFKALSQSTPSPAQLVIKREYGYGSNKVYGYGQCLFTSLSQSDCNVCIQRAINQTGIQCPYAIGAKIIYEECLVSYGTQDSNSDAAEIILVNVNTYTKDSPFQCNLDKVWNLLKMQAPMSGSPVALVTGNDQDKVYGFGQCGNVSISACTARFDSGLNAVGSAVGARIFYLDSFFRYENYNFFTGGVPFQVVY